MIGRTVLLTGRIRIPVQAACQSSKQSVPFCPVEIAVVGVVEPENATQSGQIPED